MAHRKSIALSRMGRFYGATKPNGCYENSLELLRGYGRGKPGWSYVEGMAKRLETGEVFHHGWLCCGDEIVDPTAPDMAIIYCELLRRDATEFLVLTDVMAVELPLCDENGDLAPQTPTPY